MTRQPALRPRRRALAATPLRRWLQVAMVAWIGLVLAGREHVLQAIGIQIACVHPGDRDPVHGASREVSHHEPAAPADAPAGLTQRDTADDALQVTSDLEDGDDCPIGCTDCACGGALFSLPMRFAMTSRPWRDVEFALPAGRTGPPATPSVFDRPPRLAA